MREGGERRSWRWVVVIVAVTLLAHGLMAVNDGIFWDDWLLLDFLQSGPRAEVWNLAVDRGIPTDALIWFGIGALPHVVISYKVVVLVLLALSGLLTYQCALTCGLSSEVALAVACLAVAYPGYEAWVVLITAQYLIYYVLFLAASWIALHAARRGVSAWQRRITAAALFYLSYGLNSLLVWSIGVCALLVLLERRHAVTPLRQQRWQAQVNFVLRCGYPFAAALAYWLVKRVFFPPQGFYAQYNAIRLTLRTVVHPLVFLANGVVRPVGSSLTDLLRHPGILIFAIIVALVVTRVAKNNDVSRPWIPLVAASIMGLVLAVTPYALVGIEPGRHGWSTRHNILLAIPVGLMIVGLKRAIVARYPRAESAAHAVVALVVLAFAFRSAETHLGWIGRWAATRAILQDFPESARSASVVWLDNRVAAPSDEPYRFYEWAVMLQRLDHREDHMVLPYEEASKETLALKAPFRSQAYRLSQWQMNGCQTALRIARGSAWISPVANGKHYLARRLRGVAQTDRWLDSLVIATPIPLPKGVTSPCVG